MIPTLFSVSYAGLWGQQKLELVEFIQKAAALGYSAVEIMAKKPHLDFVEISDDELKRVCEAAAADKVEIATLAAYTNFTGGREAAEVPMVDMQVAYVRSLARMGRVLGAKIVRVFTGYSSDRCSPGKDWQVCVEAVRACAQAAEEFGLIVGLQNHHDIGVGYDAYREFLVEVDHPNCRAMFDPWSVALQGEDLRRCAREMAGQMVQTTLADYVRLKRFEYQPGLVNYAPADAMLRAVPLGEGFIDLEGFFAGLREGGFQGYVVYEMCSPLRRGGSEANLDHAAKISLATIQRLISDTKCH